jgi:arginase family enzyme
VQVSLDIDGVRSIEAPGCSAPQVLGFHAEEAIAMAELAGAEAAVTSFGIYELSPALDPSGITAAVVTQCIVGFFRGYSKRQSQRKIRKKP